MIAAPQPIEIRPAHRFDEAALSAFLSSNLEGFAGPARIRQFQGGQSNPTFLIETPNRSYVLRKKPPGKLLPSAHQVEREYAVMKALHGTGIPVPTPLILCEDPEIFGTAFYVMEFIAGRVFPSPGMPDESPAQRKSVYTDMFATLAKLHAVDWRTCGLEGFGRPEGYIRRQIERWTKQYNATKIDAIPGMERLMSWLPDRIPQGEETAIAHGDFRLGNLIIHPTEGKVVAVVDWELSTIGHPLADLAYSCMAYHLPPDDPVFAGLAGLDLAKLGIPDEAQSIAAYCGATGRGGIPDWPFYLAFSFFRICAITQGVYARGIQGNASDAAAQKYGAVAKRTGEIGWSIAQSAG
ncbi:MAG: phosphotransferase family protein [Rhodobacteraceae bacterium]|nr:phosphotransferase family protein [Paracoccaceae bacterium]